jgi:hypothetical protein
MFPDVEVREGLPLRVRIRRLETPASYAQRLEEANFLNAGTLRVLARSLAPRTGAGVIKRNDMDIALETLLETAAGLQPGFFERQREAAGEGTDLPRYMCPFCAHGWVVEQMPHALDYCCLRHRLWTGPGTSATTLRGPEGATPGERLPPLVFVSDDVLLAERRYRKLRTQGRAPAALIAELVEVVGHETPGRVTGLPTPAHYPAVVSIAWMLSKQAFLQSLLDPRRTYAQARNFLNTNVRRALPGAGASLRDALWLLLRPTFLWVRQTVLGESSGRELRPLIEIDRWDAAHRWTVQRPLEPFSRYLDQLELVRGTSWPELAEMYLVAGSCTKPRIAVRGRGGPRIFICAAGHILRRGCAKVAQALALGKQFCPICSGKTALAGYNSLAEIYPLLASQWDPERNASLNPGDVVPRSNKMVHWICPRGHRYPATICNRALNGSGCAVCANFAVLTGTNDLATSHPALAAEWHPNLNGDVRPEHVISGSNNKFAWLCPNGHTYWKTIQKRKSGQGCSTCSGRRIEVGDNDLATTHPGIAAEWHPTKNGKLTPQHVSFGSDELVYWLCAKGHDYPAPINNRTGSKRAGCPYCSHRKLWSGFNDLATQYPDLARDWAPDLNGGLSASGVLPGSCRRGWRCAFGHEQHTMFRNRLRAGGCTKCPVEKRADRNDRE